jgi:hypothetical protein
MPQVDLKQIVVNQMAKIENIVDTMTKPLFEPLANIASKFNLPQPPKPVKPSQILSQVLPSMTVPVPFSLPGQQTTQVQAAQIQPIKVQVTAQPQPQPQPEQATTLVAPLTIPRTPMREIEVPEDAILV